MSEKLPEAENSEFCDVYDFGLIVARKKLAAYGVTPEDFKDPDPCPVVDFEPAKQKILARTALELSKVTPELQLHLRNRYESAATSTKLFFQLPGFSPPEHGDISF